MSEGTKRKPALLTDIDLKIFKKLLEKDNVCLTDLTDHCKKSNRDVGKRLKLMEKRGFVVNDKVEKMNKRRISLKEHMKPKIKTLIDLFDS